MELIVDGIIYCLQSKGGISRLFREILLRMCETDDSLNITLLIKGRLKQALPRHRHIKHRSIPDIERYLRPKRIWSLLIPAADGLIQKILIGQGSGKVWHSTYYTLPQRWKGHSVVTVHDMIFEQFRDFYNGQNADLLRDRKQQCIRSADAVICVSETTRRDVKNFYGFNSDSIYVVPNACSDVFRQLEQSVDTSRLPTDRPFLLYVGIRSPYKNFGMLMQAYSKWHRQKEVTLVLVGARPWSDDERRQLARLQIQDCVHLLQDVDDETLCRLYNKAAAFVFPSLCEGFGIPLLEAMTCGCPIVASRIPSTIEVAGDCPIYFDPAEEDDLLIALDTALSEGRNSARIQTGLKRVKSYSWDKTAAQTLEVYRNLYA
ncbi:MAG: glycosyltransferase family 1 protein [Phycisphaerae bacterium]|nr:glycosyltransferase family 1 protein [Phycisphaerae bacterium]MDD5381698.1 glycosyltransferase family 1 protein [Phycisphaerae bacterium]